MKSFILSTPKAKPSLALLTTIVVSRCLCSSPALAQQATTSVVAWGYGFYGELAVPGGLDSVVGIAAGWAHDLALKQDGTVIAWGSPATVPDGLAGVVAIAAGFDHDLAIKQDGTVVAWGNNDYGQCDVPTNLTGVIAIAGGGHHSLAVRHDGTVVAWGLNIHEQCNVPAGLTGVVAVAAGDFHSLALKQDGTVVAWGTYFDGTGSYDIPMTVPSGLNRVVSIAAGQWYCLAVKQDGTVVAWGFNEYGATIVPSGLTDVIAVAGREFAALAAKRDGSIVAWGQVFDQQLQQWLPWPVPTGLSNVVSVAAGYGSALALTYSGTFQPSIQLPPRTQTAEIAASCDLKVKAVGAPALRYQWFYNATNALSGSTDPILHIANAQQPSLGAYSVVVTNVYGATTSPPAILNVIPPVPRRAVPALQLTGDLGNVLQLSRAAGLDSDTIWRDVDSVTLMTSPQLYFDLSDPLPSNGFYRTKQANGLNARPSLLLSQATAITLTGTVGSTLRIDYIPQVGPTNAWVTLDTVTLTNISQLYFDLSAFHHPPRLYRVVSP